MSLAEGFHCMSLAEGFHCISLAEGYIDDSMKLNKMVL